MASKGSLLAPVEICINKMAVGVTPLMLAARDGDLESCVKLLRAGENAHAESAFGATALHFAALNKAHGIDIVLHLINVQQVDLRKKDEVGEEAIFYALRKGNFNVAQLLLKKRNCETENLLHFVISSRRLFFAWRVHAWRPHLIKEVDFAKRNALHLAAEFCNLIFCQWLISKGIDVASESPVAGTALHRAAANSVHGTDLVRFFASLKLDVNGKTKSGGLTPLYNALIAGNLEVAKELIKLGAKSDNVDANVMFHSISLNDLNRVKFIHELNNSLIRKMDSTGRTAMQVAAECADGNVIQWLMDHGVFLYPDWKSSIPFNVAQNKFYGAQFVGFFAKLGMDVNAQDASNNTPLIHALRLGNLAVAKEFLEHGAMLHIQKSGFHALESCITENNLEGVKFLHANVPGVTKELGTEGTNALHVAAANADLKMCEWLCDQSVDVLALSEKYQNTVLHFAPLNSIHGKDLVAFFVSKGVDVNAKNRTSKTAFHNALSTENIGVAEELLNSGADINVVLDHDNVLHFCTRRNKLLSAKFVVGVKKELIGAATHSGMTALHLAAQAADLDFCKFLVEAGADTNAVNSFNQSALALVPRDRKDKLKYFRSLRIKKYT